jgi:glucose/arabinose dehydrogenase
MQNKFQMLLLFFTTVLAVSCHSTKNNKTNNSKQQKAKTAVENITLPEPYATPSVRNGSKVIGWPEGKTPVAPVGFTVTKFADGLDHPRWLYVGPNGDIFVSEANTVSDGFTKAGIESTERNTSKNSILLLRDADHDGIPEVKQLFLTGLNRPLGMLILENKFYVANTDAIWVFPYKQGETQMTAQGKKILDLPAGGYNNHWTRNLMANKDGSKIYVTVGSGSNVAEHGIDNEKRRACILEINPDGSGERIFAGGLRNPVGLAWQPGTNILWTAVNERDGLGDDLVPDYATSVKENEFYGWPYAYFGNHEDPRRKGERPDLVAKTLVPDIPLGSHTASLGIAFDDKNYFGSQYSGGLFIAQHGSWNRSVLTGYKLVFVPFKNGKPSGPRQDFLTDFIAEEKTSKVYGRPVGVVFAQDGSLLVTDDGANIIWRVTLTK